MRVAVGLLAGVMVLAAFKAGCRQKDSRSPDQPQPHSVTVSWRSPDPGSSVSEFNVYRADLTENQGKGECAPNFAKIAVVKMPATSYRDEKVESQRSYCYTITSVSPQGESLQSERIVATVP